MPMNDPYRTEAPSLLDLLLSDQGRRWQQGEHVLVEAFLSQQPELHGNTAWVLSLLHHEVQLRAQAGEQPELAEYLRRFPHLAAELKAQFEVHRALGLA